MQRTRVDAGRITALYGGAVIDHLKDMAAKAESQLTTFPSTTKCMTTRDSVKKGEGRA